MINENIIAPNGGATYQTGADQPGAYPPEAGKTGADQFGARAGRDTAPPQSACAGAVATAYVPREKQVFKPEISDFVFALAAFALGYLFSRWVLFSWHGWGVSVFTASYLLIVTAYLIKKGAFAGGAAAWFWLAVTFATGVSFALWGNPGFNAVRSLFLFCSAVYYVLTASERAILGKTGNYLLIDGLNTVLLIPLRNLLNQYVSFAALRKGEKRGKGLPVFLGVLLAVFLLICITPMLRRADSGGFGAILNFLADVFSFNVTEILFYLLFAIPVAAYLYGLASGAAHNRNTDTIKPEGAKKAVAALKLFQPTTVFIALGAVCGLYLVFIFSQTPYFFSAFTGRRPDGWLVYSEYARQGFFELCWIAAINLIILIAGNVTSRKRRIESRLLKAFNIALAVITLALIATAFSKMALYISAYGLTMPRLLPCVFMVFMTVVFIALIALQKRDFSIVRFALAAGAVILCALCLINPDALVARYNTDRYLNGTLARCDMEVIRRAGDAGVAPAIEVYMKTGDERLKTEISMYLVNYLEWQEYRAANWPLEGGGRGHNQSFESYSALKNLRAFKDNP